MPTYHSWGVVLPQKLNLICYRNTWIAANSDTWAMNSETCWCPWLDSELEPKRMRMELWLYNRLHKWHMAECVFPWASQPFACSLLTMVSVQWCLGSSQLQRGDAIWLPSLQWEKTWLLSSSIHDAFPETSAPSFPTWPPCLDASFSKTRVITSFSSPRDICTSHFMCTHISENHIILWSPTYGFVRIMPIYYSELSSLYTSKYNIGGFSWQMALMELSTRCVSFPTSIITSYIFYGKLTLYLWASVSSFVKWARQHLPSFCGEYY